MDTTNIVKIVKAGGLKANKKDSPRVEFTIPYNGGQTPVTDESIYERGKEENGKMGWLIAALQS